MRGGALYGERWSHLTLAFLREETAQAHFGLIPEFSVIQVDNKAAWIMAYKYDRQSRQSLILASYHYDSGEMETDGERATGKVRRLQRLSKLTRKRKENSMRLHQCRWKLLHSDGSLEDKFVAAFMFLT